jgi:hypothetical protein
MMKRLFFVLLFLPVAGIADERPDFSGYYDIATMTPLSRPGYFGDKQFITREEAEEAAANKAARSARANAASDPDRGAPPAGGDGSPGAAGNVGGYNNFWIDNGDSNFEIDGKFRTSIIYDPPNGRRPARTEKATAALRQRYGGRRQNTGVAYWMPGPGPYDHPEKLTMSDRCLLGFGSTGGPPALPVLYNNVKRIVQTEDHVMILTEMVHDARVVRMNSEHVDPEITSYLGDSIGWWEGDTLVVDTTNFNHRPALGGASPKLHVVERFSKLDDGNLLYNFTVEDPETWEQPWSGEYPWPKTDSIVYEYACHEGNYAMGNILRGARLLESEAMSKAE